MPWELKAAMAIAILVTIGSYILLLVATVQAAGSNLGEAVVGIVGLVVVTTLVALVASGMLKLWRDIR